jgi:two-component system NarL family response regulator
MSAEDPIRVLIVDDHPVIRTGLALMLKYEPNMEAVGEARNGREAVALFRERRPDVTLMDLRMPDMDGAEAITAIRAECPMARIILLTTYDGDEDIYRGLRAGAKAYLLKDAPCEELLETIRLVRNGQKCITAEVGAKLAERLEGPELTERERQVLRLMAGGRSNYEIGAALFITEGTVKFHVNHILNKLGVNDRTQAVIVALKRGIASLD